MSTKPVRVIIDSKGNWQYKNLAAQPLPQGRKILQSSGGDRDAWHIRDEAQNILWWIDGFGVPHFPNDGSGALPTPSAAETDTIPGIRPSGTIFVLMDASKNPLGWVNSNPDGYGGTLASQ